MAKNFVQTTGVKQWTNITAGAISSGGIVVAGNVIGVALVDIAVGAVGSVDFTPGHVFDSIPKVSGAVFLMGEKLIWDVSAGKFDDSAATPATGDVTGAAVAWIAGANAETTCSIMLTPGNSTVTA